MIKKLAWNTFKNTGDINTFLEFTKIENAEKQLKFSELNGIENKIDINNNIKIDREE